MLENNSNYLIDFTQNNVKEVMKNLENYTGRLVVTKEESDIETTYLEFVNKNNGEVMKFSLH